MSSSAKADDPVNTNVSYLQEAARNTGCPAGACHRARIRAARCRGMTTARKTTSARAFKLCLSLPLARCRYMPSPKPDQQEPVQRKPQMSIDFEVPAEAKAIREKVRKWG